MPFRPWARFQAAHLFDYPPGAQRLWLATVAAGALVLAWALHRGVAGPGGEHGLLLAGLGAVALAAMFPLQVPRFNVSLSASEVFIFSLLVTLGPAAAVLGSGLDGWIGARRTSRRLSSHLGTPSAGMAGMALAGLVFEALHGALAARGLASGVAALAALVAVSLVPFVVTTIVVMGILQTKRGLPWTPLAWLADTGWMGATYLGAALFAGLVHLNVQRFGPTVLAVAGLATFGLLLLLRATVARHEADRARQEAHLAEARREAELSQQRFSAAFTHAAIGMAIVEQERGTLLQANRALAAIVGHPVEALVGQPFAALLHPADVALLRRRADEARALGDGAFSIELRCGEDTWVALHCSRYDGPADAGGCLIYQLHDITSRHLAESRLQHIAFHDGLTDLANRSCFQQRLEAAVEVSRLDPAVRFAVAFLDLDRFKVVNDSLGHIGGNTLLRETAERLRASVRPVDLVARLGGDEFAILLEGLHDHDDGLRLADRVLAALAQPVSINGTEVLPGASMGITFSDLGYRTVDEVLRDADLAMYEAKAAGRGRVVLFDSSMHERVAEKLALEADLRHAIGEGQLEVHFQPLYALDELQLTGFEALARWNHPQRGPVSPAVFITIAEESGHIEALTDWMIDHGVAQLAAWQAEAPGREHLGVQVNVSGRDLARADLVDQVQAALERHGLPPGRLTLEITETTLMERLDAALANLARLRALGVRLAIDDFGTGYSSLAYLSTLPIDSLKIDRSFVQGMEQRPASVEIVRAVLNLGRSLGRRVVAEGIETPGQLALLRQLGVHGGQGYLLGRPLRAEQVGRLLATGLRVTV